MTSTKDQLRMDLSSKKAAAALELNKPYLPKLQSQLQALKLLKAAGKTTNIPADSAAKFEAQIEDLRKTVLQWELYINGEEKKLDSNPGWEGRLASRGYANLDTPLDLLKRAAYRRNLHLKLAEETECRWALRVEIERRITKQHAAALTIEKFARKQAEKLGPKLAACNEKLEALRRSGVDLGDESVDDTSVSAPKTQAQTSRSASNAEVSDISMKNSDSWLAGVPLPPSEVSKDAATLFQILATSETGKWARRGQFKQTVEIPPNPSIQLFSAWISKLQANLVDIQEAAGELYEQNPDLADEPVVSSPGEKWRKELRWLRELRGHEIRRPSFVTTREREPSAVARWIGTLIDDMEVLVQEQRSYIVGDEARMLMRQVPLANSGDPELMALGFNPFDVARDLGGVWNRLTGMFRADEGVEVPPQQDPEEAEADEEFSEEEEAIKIVAPEQNVAPEDSEADEEFPEGEEDIENAVPEEAGGGVVPPQQIFEDSEADEEFPEGEENIENVAPEVTMMPEEANALPLDISEEADNVEEPLRRPLSDITAGAQAVGFPEPFAPVPAGFPEPFPPVPADYVESSSLNPDGGFLGVSLEQLEDMLPTAARNNILTAAEMMHNQRSVELAEERLSLGPNPSREDLGDLGAREVEHAEQGARLRVIRDEQLGGARDEYLRDIQIQLGEEPADPVQDEIDYFEQLNRTRAEAREVGIPVDRPIEAGAEIEAQAGPAAGPRIEVRPGQGPFAERDALARTRPLAEQVTLFVAQRDFAIGRVFELQERREREIEVDAEEMAELARLRRMIESEVEERQRAYRQRDEERDAREEERDEIIRLRRIVESEVEERQRAYRQRDEERDAREEERDEVIRLRGLVEDEEMERAGITAERDQARDEVTRLTAEVDRISAAAEGDRPRGDGAARPKDAQDDCPENLKTALTEVRNLRDQLEFATDEIDSLQDQINSSRAGRASNDNAGTRPENLQDDCPENLRIALAKVQNLQDQLKFASDRIDSLQDQINSTRARRANNDNGERRPDNSSNAEPQQQQPGAAAAARLEALEVRVGELSQEIGAALLPGPAFPGDAVARINALETQLRDLGQGSRAAALIPGAALPDATVARITTLETRIEELIEERDQTARVPSSALAEDVLTRLRADFNAQVLEVNALVNREGIQEDAVIDIQDRLANIDNRLEGIVFRLGSLENELSDMRSDDEAPDDEDPGDDDPDENEAKAIKGKGKAKQVDEESDNNKAKASKGKAKGKGKAKQVDEEPDQNKGKATGVGGKGKGKAKQVEEEILEDDESDIEVPSPTLRTPAAAQAPQEWRRSRRATANQTPNYGSGNGTSSTPLQPFQAASTKKRKGKTEDKEENGTPSKKAKK